MRTAVFGDIHGNLEALEAVLADMSVQSVEDYVCLGDLVGYGASPRECIDRVRSLDNCRVVKGNHDAAATWEFSPYAMTKNATAAIMWTMDQLDEERTEYLKSLPPIHTADSMTFCHATPANPEGWGYILTKKQAALAFLRTKARKIFVAHTHQPSVMTRNSFFSIDIRTSGNGHRYKANGNRRRIFNCGSVGQPRNGDPRATYLILDREAQEVFFRRVEYDHEPAAAKIREAGLPEVLGARLSQGR